MFQNEYPGNIEFEFILCTMIIHLYNNINLHIINGS